MPLKHIFLVTLVPLIWGIQAVMLKIGLGQFPPIFMVGMRFSLMAVLLAPFLSGIRGKLGPALLVSATQGIAHFSLLYIGFQYTDVSAGIIAYQTNAIFTIMLGAILLKERVSVISFLGVMLAFAGVGLIVGAPKGEASLTGLLIIISSALMFAIGNIIARRFGPFKTTALNATVSLVSTIGLLVISALTETGQWHAVQSANWQGWGALLYTSLIGGIAGFSIWYWVLNRYSVDRIAPFGLLMPMFAMADSVTLLNEQITSLHLLGAAFTIGGVAIAQFGPRMLAAWRTRKVLAESAARRALGQDVCGQDVGRKE